MFRWTLTNIRFCYHLNTLYIWGSTDIPTHSILRWTGVPPRLSKTWPKRRGIPHEMRDRYITAEWRSIGQNEAGLTTEKTFTWPGWPPLETYWFLFTHWWGKWVENSQSPLFNFGAPADPAWTTAYWEPFT